MVYSWKGENAKKDRMGYKSFVFAIEIEKVSSIIFKCLKLHIFCFSVKTKRWNGESAMFRSIAIESSKCKSVTSDPKGGHSKRKFNKMFQH